MKVPSETIDTLDIVRVFPPARTPVEWNMLYAEFADISHSDLILSFARHLQPGKQVSLYVPARLQPRFSAVNSLAHEFRTGPKQCKTRVEYGISEFILLIKPKHGSHSWTYASLSSLPSFQLAPIVSSSPPLGRSRYEKKTYQIT